MTGDHDRLVGLRAWLHDDPPSLPDRGTALQRTLERVALTPQRSRRLPFPGVGRTRSVRDGRTTRRFDMLPIPAVLAVVALAVGGAVAGTALLSSTPDASPGVIVVAQDGSGDVATIGEAVALAQAGDTVLVRPGTYRESVRVTADITVRGDGEPDAVVIEVPEDASEVPEASSPYVDGFYGLFLEGTDARIEAIKVLGLQSGLAVVVRGGSPVIERVTIDLAGDWVGAVQHPHTGLVIDGGSTATVTDVSVAGHVQIDGSPVITSSAFPKTCFHISGAGTAPLLSGSTVVGCPDGFAFSIGDAAAGDEAGATPTIRDSDISAPRGTAVLISGAGTAPIITGNVIHGSTAGVDIESGAGGIVEDNDIRDSDTGVQADGTGVATAVRGNRISGNGAGLVAMGAATPTFEGNDVRGNRIGLFIGSSDSAPVLMGNALCDNEANVVVGTGVLAPDLSGNDVCEDAAPSGSPTS